ncbi:conserved hypothetical protein [Mesorhizobium prunaredense]|uniref:Lytic murein transglycosylase n=1 Tax=Mesorhizobium prunaredense TaxID=1631249 RepID=A0A1R3VCM7_9HYPH|nr:conserved hypothetical protein [Mesorhizobium prunaredense]
MPCRPGNQGQAGEDVGADAGAERPGESGGAAGEAAVSGLMGMAFLRAPLCPAGHLPHLGGDWLRYSPRAFFNADDWRKPTRHLISPQVGEMAGRPEGGAVERGHLKHKHGGAPT